MRTLFPLLAVGLLIGCGNGSGPGQVPAPAPGAKEEKKEPGGAPAKKLGEDWLYADLIKHFESKGHRMVKHPSRKHRNTVYFF